MPRVHYAYLNHKPSQWLLALYHLLILKVLLTALHTGVCKRMTVYFTQLNTRWILCLYLAFHFQVKRFFLPLAAISISSFIPTTSSLHLNLLKGSSTSSDSFTSWNESAWCHSCLHSYLPTIRVNYNLPSSGCQPRNQNQVAVLNNKAWS